MSKKILRSVFRKTAVSAVLIESGLKSYSIEAYAYVPFSEQTKKENGLTAALESITDEVDINGTVCITSFPADQISFRNIRVPFKQQKKIRQILSFELEPRMPVPVEELIIDFQINGPADRDTDTDLLTASVDQQSLQLYLDQLAQFKIEPEIITVSGYASALCLSNLSNIAENSIFLDIDDTHTTFAALVSGKIQLVRSIPTGPDNPPGIKSLCRDIRRTMSAFSDSSDFDFKPERIFITGNRLNGNAYEQDIKNFLHISVQKIDMIRDTETSTAGKYSERWESEQTDGALALAFLEMENVKGFDLRKGPFARSRRWAEYKQSIIKSGILIGILLIVLITSTFIGYFSKKTKLKKLKQNIAAVFKETLPNEKMSEEPLQQLQGINKASKTNSMSIAATGEKVRTIDILNELSRRISDKIDVELITMSIGEENILTTGNTDTFNSVDEIKNSLEKSDIFKTVSIVSTRKEKSGIISFKLKIQI